MTYVPLAGKTHLLPPGGGGVGMHIIPVEKAISVENQSMDIEHLSYWLKKYEGHCGSDRTYLQQGNELEIKEIAIE